METFDEGVEAHVAPGRKATVKRLVSDEETLAQMQREEDARRMEEACGMFLTAERKFQKLSAHPDVVTDPRLNLAWWDALEDVYQKERTVWRLFVGPQPDLRSNMLYARFRQILLTPHKKLTADA
jgi:hypothetical protein